jgi:hypothetical protein
MNGNLKIYKMDTAPAVNKIRHRLKREADDLVIRTCKEL